MLWDMQDREGLIIKQEGFVIISVIFSHSSTFIFLEAQARGQMSAAG